MDHRCRAESGDRLFKLSTQKLAARHVSLTPSHLTSQVPKDNVFVAPSHARNRRELSEPRRGTGTEWPLRIVRQNMRRPPAQHNSTAIIKTYRANRTTKPKENRAISNKETIKRAKTIHAKRLVRNSGTPSAGIKITIAATVDLQAEVHHEAYRI